MAVIEAIATTLIDVDSTSSGIEFASIPQTFERLQLRCNLRVHAGTAGNDVYVKLNGVTSSVYSYQAIGGASSSASSWHNDYHWNGALAGDVTGWSNDSHNYNSFIMDLHDYANTNKNTAISVWWSKSVLSSPSVGRRGQLYAQTTGVTSVVVYLNGGVFRRGSIASLYGIKSS